MSSSCVTTHQPPSWCLWPGRDWLQTMRLGLFDVHDWGSVNVTTLLLCSICLRGKTISYQKKGRSPPHTHSLHPPYLWHRRLHFHLTIKDGPSEDSERDRGSCSALFAVKKSFIRGAGRVKSWDDLLTFYCFSWALNIFASHIVCMLHRGISLIIPTWCVFNCK